MLFYQSFILALFFYFSCPLYAGGAGCQSKEPIVAEHVEDKAQADRDPCLGKLPVAIEQKAENTYNQYCYACHQSGLAGAPRFRNEEDWRERLAKKTIDDLVQTAIVGVNAMPAKGTCVSCQEEELKNAIIYMMPKS